MDMNALLWATKDAQAIIKVAAKHQWFPETWLTIVQPTGNLHNVHVGCSSVILGAC